MTDMDKMMIEEVRARLEAAINERFEWDGGQSGEVEIRFDDAKALLAALSAYNPDDRLREALQRIEQVSMRADMSTGARVAVIQRFAREALSPLPQGDG